MQFKTPVEKKIDLVMKMGRALHINGVTAQGLEQALTNISEKLGLSSEFFATPTVLMASFDTTEGVKQSILRVNPAGADVGKMEALDRLGDDIIAGNINVDAALEKLTKINNYPRLYPACVEIAAYAIAGAATSVLIGGGLKELLVSLVCGALVGMVCEISLHFKKLANSYEFLAALLISLFQGILYFFLTEFSIEIVTVASLIVLLPGMSLTLSMTELATNNLNAGTSRLMHAILTFFKLGFGFAFGISLMQLLTKIEFSQVLPSALPSYSIYIAMFVITLAFNILFRGRLTKYYWMLLASSVSFFSSQLSAVFIGPDLASFVAGFLVGILANAYARLIKKPAAVILMPGVIMLVPGAVGFRGLNFLVQKNALEGVNTTFEMFMVAIAIVSGLLVANILLQPKRSL